MSTISDLSSGVSIRRSSFDLEFMLGKSGEGTTCGNQVYLTFIVNLEGSPSLDNGSKWDGEEV